MKFYPAVVIGLGGSGKWLIAHLKRSLLELNDNQIPQEVYLFSIDLSGPLDEKPPARVSLFNSLVYRKEDVYADARKNPPEFLDISCLWADPVLDILGMKSKGARTNPCTPLISRWLSPEDAKKYNLTLGDINNRGGAGQKRQGSRVAFFLMVEEIWRVLDAILQRVRASQDQKINFFIFSSLAGGTGCGIFIDTFYLLEAAIKDKRLYDGPGVNIFGIFSLPIAYKNLSHEAQRMNANCYASFREMQTTLLAPNYPVSYTLNPNLRALMEVKPDLQILNFVYFVDGYNLTDKHTLKEGLIPIVSDFILSHIIAPPHTDYPNLLATIQDNGKSIRDINQGQIYSTFGLYSYIFPAEEVIQTLAHKLALDVLEHFLSDPTTDTEVENMAQSFRNNPQNTPFNWQVVKSLLEQPEDTTLISYPGHLFNRMVTSKSLLKYADFTTADIRTSRFLRKVHSDDVIRRAEGKRDVFLRNLKFQLLSQLLAENKNEFENKLKERVKEILNGRKRGCLTLAFRFLAEMIKSYYKASENLEKLIERAGISNKKQMIEREVEALRTKLRSSDRGSDQEAYKRALEDLVKVEALMAILETVAKIIDVYREITESLLREVGMWIDTFNDGIEVVKKARDSQIEVRREKALLAGREYVTQPEDEWENKLYNFILNLEKPVGSVENEIKSKLAEKDFQRDIIDKFSWDFEQDELRCYLPAEFAPKELLFEMYILHRNKQLGQIPPEEWNEKALQWNYNFVNNFLTQSQLDSVKKLSLADILVWQGRTSNIAEFAQNIERRAEPVLQHPGSLSPSVRHWRQITTATTIADPPGAGFVAQLINHCRTNGIETLDSQNRYQLTFTHYIHLLNPKEIVNLYGAERDYRDWVRKLLGGEVIPIHNIPHHKHASEFEHKLQLDRCLNREITRWLEDKELVKNISLALAYGIIQQNFNPTSSRNEYQFQKDWLGENLPELFENIYSNSARQKDVKNAVSEHIKNNASNPSVLRDSIENFISSLQQSIAPSATDEETDLKRVILIVLSEEKDKLGSK